ncbi:MAG: hypothetical protein QM769_03310 [Pseudoxanthomonas sp.]
MIWSSLAPPALPGSSSPSISPGTDRPACAGPWLGAAAKLERIRAELVQSVGAPDLAALPLLIADSDDEATLQRLAADTRVVCTTVGPYLKYGKGLLGACAGAGTHYCDLTGEVPFIRWAIDEHDARARASGARIVPTCGFDSLPSDLGVWLVHQHLQARGHQLASAKLSVEKASGGFSGGTVASMMTMMQEAQRDPRIVQQLRDPYALLPDPSRDRGGDTDQLTVRWDAELQRWTAPFLMAAVNTRVVRRTNALLGFPYGKDFRYTEVMSFPKGPGGMLTATATGAGMLAGLALLGLGPTRELLKGRLPAPGEGPSREQRERGRFRGRVVGQSTPDASGTRHTAQVNLEFYGDPGYSETAKLLGEAALCLCWDDLPPGGGVLTPAVCMGQKLVDRLRACGQVWTVSDA